MDFGTTDWFLVEWAETLGKRQADFVRDLGWNKARVSLLWAGKQPYTRDIVNACAGYLRILPFELLMHPREALALRGLRENAMTIAAASVPFGTA
jgi:hypothetical protein